MFDVGAINTLIVWRELLALRDDASTAHILCEHTESRSSTLMRDLAIQLCDVQSVTQLVTPHAATLERQLSQSHPSLNTAIALRAVHKLAEGAFLHELFALGLLAAMQGALDVNFFITVAFSGLAYLLIQRAHRGAPWLWLVVAIFIAGYITAIVLSIIYLGATSPLGIGQGFIAGHSYWELFLLGLVVPKFLPAFAFTIIGHAYFEQAVANDGLSSFLDGIGTSVIGLIAVTAAGLLQAAAIDGYTLVVFGFSLAALYYFTSKITIPTIVLLAAIAGQLPV